MLQLTLWKYNNGKLCVRRGTPPPLAYFHLKSDPTIQLYLQPSSVGRTPINKMPFAIELASLVISFICFSQTKISEQSNCTIRVTRTFPQRPTAWGANLDKLICGKRTACLWFIDSKICESRAVYVAAGPQYFVDKTNYWKPERRCY